MKKFPYVLSCDWFSSSCYVPFAFRTFIRGSEEDCAKLYKTYRFGKEEFVLKESKEVHPCFMRSCLIEWHDVPVCSLFFGDKRSTASHAGVAKVANSFLYYGDWSSIYMRALAAVGWRHIAAKRIDIAADFELFVNGRKPLQFIFDYLDEPSASRPSFIRKSSNKYVATGVRSIAKNIVQSVRWGTRESPVQVNLYNKTQELADVKMKPWILEKWAANGLKSGLDEFKRMHWVWRVEFSINCAQLAFRTKERSKVFDISLTDVADQASLANIFAVLVPNYFQFYSFTIDNVKRKSKVRDLQPITLFDLEHLPRNVTTMTLSRKVGSGRTERLLSKVLGDLAGAAGISEDTRAAVLKTQSLLVEKAFSNDQVDRVASEEILANFIYELTTPASNKLSKMSRAIANHHAKRFARLLLCNNSEMFADYAWACDLLQGDIELLREKIGALLTQAPDEAYECWIDEEIDEEAIAQLTASSNEIDWDSFDPHKPPCVDCEETTDMQLL